MKTELNWDEIGLNNDFLFAKVMRDKEICIMVLEKLLHTKITDIVYLEEQKTIDIEKDAKSVRLDVYVEDGNRVFNVEMQVAFQKELAKRARYYQSMIDPNTMEKGESYRGLKESYVIFICIFDPFGLGRAEYTFENRCGEDESLRLEDGAYKVFFNAPAYAASENKDVHDFLMYVSGEPADMENPFIHKIDNKVAQVKESREWRLEYMTLYEREREIQEEALEEGRKEGIQEGIRALISALRSMQMSEALIAEQLMIQFKLSKEIAESFLKDNG